MRSFQDYLIIDGQAVAFEPNAVIEGTAETVFYAVETNANIWGVKWKVYGVPTGPDGGFIERDYTVNGQTKRLKVWSVALTFGPQWICMTGPETGFGDQVKFEYRLKATSPALAYIPATAEPGVPSGDNPVAFAPLLKAEGINLARIWTDLLASYGGIDQWAAAGIKPIVTTTFREAKDGKQFTLAENVTAAAYANSIATIAQRLVNAAIVQVWNEPQFGRYCPADVPQTVEGFKRIFNEYYKPLAQNIGKARMAGPSVLPHFEGAKWLRMLVDAGFYDPALTTYADFHLYFSRWSTKQQIIDAVGECKAILPAGIKIISTEFGKDVNDRDTDYTTGNLSEIYATYATLGISPMAHFMGGTMNKFAAHTKGIYSRDGKRINADVRGHLAKVNGAVLTAGSVS